MTNLKPILVLWSTPRSTSTAFEWMMRMRGDMTCFHEPFAQVWWQGDEARWPRIKPDSPRIPGLTFKGVSDQIRQAARVQPVFVKDMATHVDHLWDDPDFLGPFTNSFLIRHPAKVLTSIFARAPEYTLKELGFVDQHKLFRKLCDRDGRAPPVIDSDDLLENPYGMVEAYCKAVNIPFVPQALSWEPGTRAEVSWYDHGSWHDNLKASDGLKPQPRRHQPEVTDMSEEWKGFYTRVSPLYEELYRNRLFAESSVPG